MKMSKESYASLRDFVKPVMTPESREASPYNDVKFRWNCLWQTVPNQFVLDLYSKEDLNDDHIDTALKRLLKELTH